MMWRTLSTLAAISLILPLGTYAAQLQPENSKQPENVQIAQMFSRKGRGYGGGGIKKLTEKLDLTEEQSTQIEAIQEKYRAANEENYQQLEQAREEMRSLLSSDANPNQLRQQHQEMQSLRQQLGNNRFEAMLEVRDILTPEQRQKMADMMAQRRGRRGYNRQ